MGPQTVGALFGAPVEFYHLDVLGSVRMITNSAGAVVTRRDYLAFGEETGALTGDPRRFTGKELDPETALQYFGARYYRQESGRLTSVDRVFTFEENVMNDPQRWNRYSYARNNPLGFIDLRGLCVKKSQAADSTSPDDICQETAKLRTDKRGQDFIRKHEGTRLNVYFDSADNLTVGIGHKVRPENKLTLGDKVAIDLVNKLFAKDVQNAEHGVRQMVGGLPLSQNEFNALVDLVFNVGSGTLGPNKSPGLNKAIREGDYGAMAQELRYTKDSAGQVQPALITRSEERRALFSGTYRQ